MSGAIVGHVQNICISNYPVRELAITGLPSSRFRNATGRPPLGRGLALAHLYRRTHTHISTMRRTSAFAAQALTGLVIALASATLAALPLLAQPRAVTAADYARAEQFLPFNTVQLVLNASVTPTWLSDDRFTYSEQLPDRTRRIFLVDASKGTRTNCSQTPVCAPRTTGQGGFRSVGGTISPDGRKTVYIKNWNLYVRDIATSTDTQVTFDGAPDFGYATDNAGWVHSDDAILLWSPDSKKIATFQQDQRGVKDMYLVTTNAGHAELTAWKYPLPGDSVIATISRVVIDLSSAIPKVIRFKMPPDQHRSSVCDHVSCVDGEFADVQWYPDGSKVAFVSSSRDHKIATLRIADAETGAVRDVLREEVKTQFESGDNVPNWRILPASNEVLWFSERDNWGQLYLYDLTTGAFKHQVTSGPGNVQSILRIDPKTRRLWFVGVGREATGDPYFRHMYRVGLDGKSPTLLTPEDGDHNVLWGPDYKYFIDSWSRPDLAPTTVLRDGTTGKLILPLQKADVSKLLEMGWKPPTRIIVKARDGVTDLYGLMFTPNVIDSTRKYPIINYIYPGPQTGSVGSRSFAAAHGDNQALAELGFVVVMIDGMGTPMRSKSFHDAYYGRMGDNTLPDQIAGMKELAARYKFIDIDKVGIWGHSGGGFATADAMFRYPDFFKVGIAESGNHDNRVYEDDWGERYQGRMTHGPNGVDNYEPEANQSLAKNLKGKLMLAHGTMDDNVPQANTMLVVDALIKSNKSFDLVMLPNLPHGYGPASNYMMRRRWDYFVQNLLGETPPDNFLIAPNPRP
jgi:dipeptidyl-peptidase-4